MLIAINRVIKKYIYSYVFYYSRNIYDELTIDILYVHKKPVIPRLTRN